VARTLGARAIVMLKNDNAALPLSSSIGRLAIVGPLADAAFEMGGPWALAGQLEANVSVVAGLRSALPDTEIGHASGVAIEGYDTSGVQEMLGTIDAAEAIILCLGEAANMSGEAASSSVFADMGGSRS